MPTPHGRETPKENGVSVKEITMTDHQFLGIDHRLQIIQQRSDEAVRYLAKIEKGLGEIVGLLEEYAKDMNAWRTMEEDKSSASDGG